ncbi:hypothetical protein GOQ25_04270 [Bordetella sp. 15P40C-2]|nr:hypothetical protein [Bordetella sp. 15P40C-2]
MRFVAPPTPIIKPLWRKQMKNRGKRQFVKRILSVACVLAGLSPTLSAAQQNYPEKSIRVIVPFSPGGGADALGRELAKKMSEYLGVSVYVENLPGASTIIGTDRAAKAAPDGYTVLLTSTTTFGTNPHLIKSLPYTLDDFSGISLLAENPLVLAASTNTPFNTIGELVTFAKDAKQPLTFGTQGQGGTSHLAGEMMKSELGIDMIDVPYKGSSPGLMDLVGNQLPLLVDGTVASLPLFKDGLTCSP